MEAMREGGKTKVNYFAVALLLQVVYEGFFLICYCTDNWRFEILISGDLVCWGFLHLAYEEAALF